MHHVQALQDNLQRHGAILPPIRERKKTLVLDLDETLVHSSFKVVEHIDIVVPVEIDNKVCHVYVAVRPGAQQFLKKMAKIYELVI